MSKDDIDAHEQDGQDGPIVAGYLTSWTDGREKSSFEDIVEAPGYIFSSLEDEFKAAKRNLDAGVDS